MWLIVGLGNPGKEYENTRHNVGFWAVEALCDKHRLSGWKEKAGALYVRGSLPLGSGGSTDVVVAKPQTYMNRSGEPTQALATFFKIDPAHTVVVHDELDFQPGVVRVKWSGGAAGNNGIRSLIANIGPDFVRVRMGVGKPPADRSGADFVLAAPKGAERALLDEAVMTAVGAVELVLKQGVAAAMGQVNGSSKATK